MMFIRTSISSSSEMCSANEERLVLCRKRKVPKYRVRGVGVGVGGWGGWMEEGRVLILSTAGFASPLPAVASHSSGWA